MIFNVKITKAHQYIFNHSKSNSIALNKLKTILNYSFMEKNIPSDYTSNN